MGLYRSLWIFISHYGSLLVLIRPDGFYWVFMGPYRSLCVLMDSNGSLYVLICTYGF